jgi:hypothetical protein
MNQNPISPKSQNKMWSKNKIVLKKKSRTFLVEIKLKWKEKHDSIDCFVYYVCMYKKSDHAAIPYVFYVLFIYVSGKERFISTVIDFEKWHESQWNLIVYIIFTCFFWIQVKNNYWMEVKSADI